MATDDLKARIAKEIARLRDVQGDYLYLAPPHPLLTEVHSTIATLEAQLAAYHAALQYIADATDLYEPCGWAVHSARTAINRKDEA